MIALSLAVVAVVHLALTPLLYWDSVANVVDGGVVASIDADPSLVELRGVSFWYVTAGLAFLTLALALAHLERRDDVVPSGVASALMLVGLWGMLFRPAFEFIAVIRVGALAGYRRRSHRRTGVDFTFGTGPATHWTAVTIDRLNPPTMAVFWGELLGMESPEPLPGWRRLHRPDGRGVAVTLQPVAEANRHWVRLHLDLTVTKLEHAMDRVRALRGSSAGERHHYQAGIVQVMCDPEGREFCMTKYSEPDR